MTDAMPSPEALERVFHKALQDGDVRGVDASLRLLVVKDPGRAVRLYDGLSIGINLALQRMRSEERRMKDPDEQAPEHCKRGEHRDGGGGICRDCGATTHECSQMTDARTTLYGLITEHSSLTGARANRLAEKIAAEWLPTVAIDASHLAHQREWSRATFGPGKRTGGVVDHIRKELVEVEDDPDDPSEWVDVLILAFDGAWRAGWEPQQVIDGIKAKQARNEAREWPDWRGQSQDRAIEHIAREVGGDRG